MKNTLHMNKILGSGISILIAGMILALCSFFLSAQDANAQTFSSTMKQGSRGGEVTQLQTFLASNNSIYPQGLVTGYYGSLTSSAVEQFQLRYGLEADGIVGPRTRAVMNAVVTLGQGIDLSAPMINNVNTQTTNSGATVTWQTNEGARSKIYYSPTPLAVHEVAPSPYVSPSISGTQVVQNTGLGSSNQISLTGLNPNTNYYYAVESIDASGNVSVSWPTFFRTQ